MRVIYILSLFLILFSQVAKAEEEFKMRYYNNLQGNIKIIGNTVLQSDTPDAKKSNDEMVLRYIDIDKDPNTFNSSSATIESILDGIDVKKSKIVWAGLYWAGYLHNDEHDPGIDNTYHFDVIGSKSDVDKKINQVLDNQKIYLKIDDGSYIPIKPEKVYKFRFNYIQYYSYPYVSYIYTAFADITKLLKEKNIAHTYTVANIPTRSGQTGRGWWGDGLGNFSAWTLVIVYDNSANSNEKMRNVTIYDGFKLISGWIPNKSKVTINFSGFKTPRSAPKGVDSKIAIFAVEGDRYILGDKAVLTNQDGYSYTLPFPNNTDSYFASTIDGVPNRNPKIDNNNGIDIHINNVGTLYGKDKPIKTNQSKASLTMSSTTTGYSRDLYIPTMVAFTTQLFTPKMCYDYVIKTDDVAPVISNNREFEANNILSDNIVFKIMLRSKETDFDIINAKEYLVFTPDGEKSFSFEKAKVSLSNTNFYNDVEAIDKEKGIIPIGSKIGKNGGVISARERIYSKLFYKLKRKDFKGKFDLVVEGDISFDGTHYAHYKLSTGADEDSPYYIPRCPTSDVYEPIYGRFNIENAHADASQSEETKASLYTQITGIPYKISIASYTKGSDNKFNTPAKRDMSVELELINAESFKNSKEAGFDSVCEDPDTLGAGKFIRFKDQDRISLNITPDTFPNYPFNLALRKAAFRIWYLGFIDKDGNKVMIPHKCSSPNDAKCFDQYYNKYFQTVDTNKYCEESCKNSSNDTCYKCLKRYYGIAVCSRDLFAIRPAGFNIIIKDNNQSNSKTNVTTISQSYGGKKVSLDLAAEYKYLLDTTASTYLNKDVAKGYYYIPKKSNNKRSTMFFNDYSGCYDKVDRNIKIVLYNGVSKHSDSNDTFNIVENNNTGRYNYHIEDSEWTKIDQIGNNERPFPNHKDCIPDSAQENAQSLDALRGCMISSNNNKDFHDITLVFHPYKFDISTINVYSNRLRDKRYFYINDLNQTQDLIKNKNVMALTIQGKIDARGYRGGLLSNYNAKCTAQDLDINITYNITPSTIKDINGNNLQLDTTLYDDNIDSNVSISSYGIGSYIPYKFKKEHFVPSLKGSSNFVTYDNFKRTFNIPVNPFSIKINTLSLKSNEKMWVEMKNNHTLDTNKTFNKVFNVYYAKIRSEENFYDDITENFVNTPIEIALFCNQTLEYCRNYGIDVSRQASKEYDWWLLPEYSDKDGNIELTTKDNESKTQFTPKNIANFRIENGKSNNTKVEIVDNSLQKPYTSYIIPTQTMVQQAPWLLYNPYANNVPPYIFKVRFVNPPANWSGKGETGHTAPFKANRKKTKKIDW